MQTFYRILLDAGLCGLSEILGQSSNRNMIEEPARLENLDGLMPA